MKKLFIIANWKSNKTTDEATAWLHGISNFPASQRGEQFPISNEKEIIVCPPFTLLPLLKSYLLNHKSNIKVGAQNVSLFDEGSYTGEESANQIKEFAEFVIIGHSERRKNFSETDEMLSQKVQKALEHNLTPIFCVQGIDTPVPQGVTIVAYEPVSAIGTGNPDTPENAEKVSNSIKQKYGTQYIIYGGSVIGDNVKSFTQIPSIDGVLVGGASLDAEKFMQIIKNS